MFYILRFVHCQMTSSILTTGFQKRSNPGTEMAILKHLKTTSMLIWMYVLRSSFKGPFKAKDPFPLRQSRKYPDTWWKSAQVLNVVLENDPASYLTVAVVAFPCTQSSL